MPADNDSSVDLLKRRFVKVAAASIAFPTILNTSAYAYLNQPKGGSVVLGLNVPLTGPYADEGADELRDINLR